MVFRVEETLTWRDWDAWQKTHILQNSLVHGAVQSAVKIRRGYGLFLLAIGLCVLVIGVRDGGWYLLLGVGILAVGGVFFRPGTLRQELSSQLVEQELAARFPDRQLSMAFSEPGFSEVSGEVWEDYEVVTGVVEDRERFYLLLRGEMRYILRKDAFTQGVPEDFRQWIGERTGRPVEFVK